MYACFMVVVFLSAYAFAAKERTRCSKFAYDEQLLEKMVKTELSLEEVQKEFAELRQEVKRMLETAHSNEQDIENEKLKLREDFEELKGKGVQGILDDVRSLYSTLRDNLTATVATPVIAFKASDPNKRSVSIGDVLQFPTVLFNVGRWYNSSDGTFTAPIKGLYMFTVQVCLTSPGYFSGKFVVDETEVSRFDAGDGDKDTCHTGDALTQMDEGQKAYVRVLMGADLFHNEYTLTSFAGALLNKH